MGIYKRGAVYWARWTEDGGKRWQSLGTGDRREAERLFDELRAGGQLTMRSVLSEWFEHQEARCKPRSIHLYRIVRKRFTAMWGELQPREVTTRVVEEAQETLLKLGRGPTTINHQIGIALGAIAWANERGLTDAEPPRWKRLKVRNGRARKYLTPTELHNLLKTAKKAQWKRLETVVMLSLYSGLRSDEIVWLTWSDVDLEQGWLHVRSKKGWSPKSSTSERSIPIAKELAAHLSRLPDDGKWVAPQSPGKQWCRRHLGTQTRKLFRAAGVDDDGPHTLHRLRGTFATSVLRGGGDLESLREVLGHSVLSVTAGYLTATSDSKRRAIRGARFAS